MPVEPHLKCIGLSDIRAATMMKPQPGARHAVLRLMRNIEFGRIHVIFAPLRVSGDYAIICIQYADDCILTFAGWCARLRAR